MSPSTSSLRIENGVFVVDGLSRTVGRPCETLLTLVTRVASLPDVKQYAKDYEQILQIVANGAVKTVSYRRLKFLSLNFDVHRALNDSVELEGTQTDPRDFSTVMKVDTHIHLSAAMVRLFLPPFSIYSETV